FCLALVYVVVKLRLHHLLRRASLPSILAVARALASGLCRVCPSVEDEIVAALRQCYPLAPEAASTTARAHLSPVVFSTLLFPVTSVVSSGELRAMFDVSALEPVVAASRSRMVVLVVTHFYHFLMLPLFAELFFEAGVPICCSFQFDESSGPMQAF